MKKAIVLFKDGYEEIEALSVVDVFRRANVECLMVGMDKDEVTSSHQITVKMDKVFDESVKDADLVVLPGGLPGATNLRDDERVISLLKEFNKQGKLIGAICAGPISLQKAGIIKDVEFTCYPGFEEDLPDGCHQNDLVHVDGNIITGRGPAAALQFAYTLLEKIGKNSTSIQEGMQYQFLKETMK